MRENIKNIKKLVEENKKEEAQKLLPQTYKAIDKAVKRNILKKNTAARKKSRITRMVNKSLGEKKPKDSPEITPEQS